MNPNHVVDLGQTQESLSLFPNPSSGRFEVEMKDQLLDGLLEVFAADGNRIMNLVVKNQNRVSIDLSKYPAGVYWVKIAGKVGRMVVGD